MVAEGPGRQPDVDEEFARIVAGWGQVAPTSGSVSVSAPSPDTAEPPEKPRQTPSAGGAPEAQQPEAGGGDPPTFQASDTSIPPVNPSPADRPADIPTTEGSAAPSAAGRSIDPSTGAVAGQAAASENEPPWRGYLPEEPEEHFSPPEPQLPPPHDATYWLAVVGLVGGPLLILWAIVFSRNPDPGWSVVAGILLTVAGFGLLVLRGSGQRDPDDDGSRV